VRRPPLHTLRPYTSSSDLEVFEEGHHGEGGAAAGDGHEHHHLAVSVDQVVGAVREAGLDGPIEVTYPASETQAYKVAETGREWPDRKSTRLNSSHVKISYA